MDQRIHSCLVPWNCLLEVVQPLPGHRGIEDTDHDVVQVGMFAARCGGRKSLSTSFIARCKHLSDPNEVISRRKAMEFDGNRDNLPFLNNVTRFEWLGIRDNLEQGTFQSSVSCSTRRYSPDKPNCLNDPAIHLGTRFTTLTLINRTILSRSSDVEAVQLTPGRCGNELNGRKNLYFHKFLVARFRFRVTA